MQRIPKWVTQYAIKSGKSILHDEMAVQLYHKWPNGVFDAVTYHSHLRQFGKIERDAHYHVHLSGFTELPASIYTLMEFEINHCRATRQPEGSKLKLFLREDEWEQVMDYADMPTVLIEHRVNLYENRFGMTLEQFQGRIRCETIPFGDLSVLMDWENLVQELSER